MDVDKIKAQAKKELKEEEFRKAVDKYKNKLSKQTIFDRLIPFKILIIRKEQL